MTPGTRVVAVLDGPKPGVIGMEGVVLDDPPHWEGRSTRPKTILVKLDDYPYPLAFYTDELEEIK
jgi:hypothetical protein